MRRLTGGGRSPSVASGLGLALAGGSLGELLLQVGGLLGAANVGRGAGLGRVVVSAPALGALTVGLLDLQLLGAIVLAHADILTDSRGRQSSVLKPIADCAILNQIVQQRQELDTVFAAIADPTRRSILERLGRGSASISELAEPAGISLTGLKKHVSVLECAGLVSTEKVGRTRRCSLGPSRLGEAERWIESYRGLLDGRLERLAELLEEQTTEGETR